jgi:hypothetical protein
MKDIICDEVYPKVKAFVLKTYGAWEMTALYELKNEIGEFLIKQFNLAYTVAEVIEKDIFLYARFSDLEAYFHYIDIEKNKEYFSLQKNCSIFCEDLKKLKLID